MASRERSVLHSAATSGHTAPCTCQTRLLWVTNALFCMNTMRDSAFATTAGGSELKRCIHGELSRLVLVKIITRFSRSTSGMDPRKRVITFTSSSVSLAALPSTTMMSAFRLVTFSATCGR